MNEQSPHRFGPFRIVRTLGRGGMGEVFVAKTPWPEQPLAAVKRLRPDVACIPTFAERFQHEAALAVRLAHPNLVSTLDVGSVNGQLYVAAELVLGKDAGYIADRLRSRSQGGPAAVAVRLLLDGLSGLAYVHGAEDRDGRSLELVHRDVTPGNLLVGYDGRARLADFGLAKSGLSADSQWTQHGEILGTPHYLSPEVVRGEAAGPAADIYQLGAVIYRFLTGVAPFQGTTTEVLEQVLTQRPRPIGQLRPDLPGWLVEVVEAMLARELTTRPADAGALAEAVSVRARADGMLVQRAAVGRWLAQLFEDEYAREVEEHDRLSAADLDPEPFDAPAEGTVVLARAVGSADPIAGPRPALASMSEDDGQGTELELSASSVLGVSPPVAAEDEMPTRALPGFGGGGGYDPGHSESHPDTDVEDKKDPGWAERGGELPGFADSAPNGGTSSGWIPQLVDPAGSTDANLVTPVEEGSPQRPVPVPIAAVQATRVVPEAPPPMAEGRSWLRVIGLFALALGAVIGLGKVALETRWTEPAAAEAPVDEGRDAKARLDALNHRLEQMQSAGRSVPAEAWRHVARAASALLAGDDGAARAHLSSAEAIVQGF